MIYVPLAMQVTPQANMQVTMQADEEVKGLLEFCVIPRARSE